MTALKITVRHWGQVALDKRGLKALMRGAANDIKGKTARLINQPAGTGRAYYGGGGGRYRGGYRAGRYRASAPGTPPVRVSGTLRSSLKAYVYKNGEGFAVRERAFYGLFLEAGAKGAGRRRLDPRPHLDRVITQEQANLDRRVRRALDQALTWKETK